MIGILGMWCGATALGWSVGELRPVQAPGALVDAALVQWGEVPAVAWSVRGGLRVHSLTDGSELLRVDVPVARIGVQDLNEDGTADLVLCGPTGIRWVRGGTDKVEQLTKRVCDDVVVVVPTGGTPGLTVRSGTEVFGWLSEGQPIHEVALEGALGDLRLAAHRGGWAGRVDGEAALHIGQGRLHGRLGAGGAVRGVAWGPEGWTWLTADGAVHSEGSTQTAPKGVVSVSAGTLSGRRALLLGVPGELRVELWVDGLAPVSVKVPVRPDRLAVGSATNDGCTDLLVLSEDGAGAVVLGACPTSR